jgi:hypothetical protein
MGIRPRSHGWVRDTWSDDGYATNLKLEDIVDSQAFTEPTVAPISSN